MILVWAGWAALMLGFQAFAQARLSLERPDRALDWTAAETTAGAREAVPYLADPFLAGHAAWDSEYYVSIALAGYDDPAMRAVGPGSRPDQPQAALKRDRPDWVTLNHAFLPGYPFAMRIVAAPLRSAGVRPVAAAVLAGVLISLLGALGAMLAIADLAEGGWAAEEGRRAGFYLLIWPGAVFLAQVYSEGLFLALSFGALALLKRRRWAPAAALGTAAVWTRATGGLLLIPFVWAWIADGEPTRLRKAPEPGAIARALCAAAPALAYIAWRVTLGRDFALVEAHYFGRGLLDISGSLQSWSDAWDALAHGEAQSRAYFAIELLSLLAALAASAAWLRRDPALALYGLAVLAVTLTSGAVLGLQRYVLSLPALFLAPAALGRAWLFDRLWTLACCLGLAALAITFSFGFWTG